MQDRKCVFVTDCEGPITKNDNAAEMSEAFLPNGHKFFQKISLYDDYLAEIACKPGYKAGDTLKLILPFFKAFGVDDRTMVKYSRRNVQIIPYADFVLKQLITQLPAYIVSTSYNQYISAVCDVIGFPFGNTYSTLTNIDSYAISEQEKVLLKNIYNEIQMLADFKLPDSGSGHNDLSDPDREIIARLDSIFWEELPKLNINKIIEDVNPVGGTEKAAAVLKIAEIEEVALENIIYFGDSITDTKAFQLLNDNGGMGISFNGNAWAVKSASFAVTSPNALPILWLTELFQQSGRVAFSDLSMTLIHSINMETIIEQSCRVRKSVRSEKIAALG